MFCETCGDRRMIETFVAKVVGDITVRTPTMIPCPDCQGLEPSCCEGSERFGQLDEPE